MQFRFVVLGLAALFSSLVLSGGALAVSLQTMAGQMVMVGFQGKTVSDAGVQAVAEDIAAGRVGGVLYLRTNVSGLEALRTINDRFLAAGGQTKPLIALDQEGGAIERLTSDIGFREIPSAARVAAGQSVEQAGRTYGQMAASLAALGFNTNLGPVVDLNINPDNPIIARYGRSYGAQTGEVVAYAGSFIDAHRRAGVLTALKHFPGHGSSRADSHEGFVDITRYWQARELDPYRALIAKGQVDMIMTAHLFHAQFAGSGDAQLPATLSVNWIEGVLRHQLGYDGVVISDDMEMGAIRSHFSLEESVVLAVSAGVDILLFSNTANYRTSLAREVVDILVSRAEADPAFRARIEQSYGRIMRLKQAL